MKTRKTGRTVGLVCAVTAAAAAAATAVALTSVRGTTAAAAAADPPSPSNRPNILVVLIDDAGYADLSCYGNKAAQTTNIDKLAEEGIRFTQFYVNSPICSPSRTALLTGQYPARWRITSYIDNRALNTQRGMAQFLDLKAPSLARSLSKAGYATGHFGKWHMGGGRDVGEAPLITEYGFDASLTQFEGLGDRVLPLMGTGDGAAGTKLPLGVASEKLGKGAVRWVPRSDVTRAFVDRALTFIQEAEKTGQPFYVNVWPDDVHSPFDPPKNLRGDGSNRALYHGVLVNMDRQLAPLFDYIRNSKKLRSNTFIIVASDNGPEPGAGSAGVFRGHKGTLYEGGIREPLITWGPGFIPAEKRGTVDSERVLSSVDLMRSVLQIARADPPEKLDGVDMSGALLGRAKAPTRKTPLFWKRPPDRPGPAGQHFPDLAVRDGEWKLLVDEDGSHAQLYNLTSDASEKTDVASQKADIVQRLKKLVLDWNRGLPARSEGSAPPGK